jgi:hypothetical protein
MELEAADLVADLVVLLVEDLEAADSVADLVSMLVVHLVEALQQPPCREQPRCR